MSKEQKVKLAKKNKNSKDQEAHNQKIYKILKGGNNMSDDIRFDRVDEDQIGRVSYQGMIESSYKNLVKVFGPPEEDDDGYKVDVVWRLLFYPGVSATIYNYKDGKNYLKSEGTPVEEITGWHVGGDDYQAVRKVKEALEQGIKYEG
jgi:hypothetical protein